MKTATSTILGAWVLVGMLVLCGGCNDAPQSYARSSAASIDANARAKKANGASPESPSVATDKRDKEEKTDPSTPEVEPSDKAPPVVRPAASARGKSLREISFDTIKFDIEKGAPFERSMLTSAIEKLDGARIRIRGYMLPSFQQSGIKQFVLVRDNMECCFGPGAALYDCIIVEMAGDQTCEFSVRPIAVEGTFTIHEFKGPDDTHLAIYHLDAERVR